MKLRLWRGRWDGVQEWVVYIRELIEKFLSSFGAMDLIGWEMGVKS